MAKFLSNTEFCKTLDECLTASGLDLSRVVLVYDRRLDTVSKSFRRFSKTFPHKYAVAAGEDLKALAKFPMHFERFAKAAEDIPARRLTILAAGGGSLGDFAGFLASVYKRGVDLVHMPTTWLAAIDSSHGGKTALNASRAKNQIGTFYPARKTMLVREILFAQDERRAFDALGELMKIALIEGGSLARAIESSKLQSENLLWGFLKDAIRAKLKVVAEDPQEKSGHRQILNLGHTLGHAFEAKYAWPHGFAIAQGLFFAIEASEAFGALKEKDADRALTMLAAHGLIPVRPTRKFSKRELTSLLMKDKKSSRKGSVTFIALAGIGKPRRVEIAIEELVREAVRQGWAQ